MTKPPPLIAVLDRLAQLLPKDDPTQVREFLKHPQVREFLKHPQVREFLTLCALSDTDEYTTTLAGRLMFATRPNADALETVMTQNAEGQWVPTVFYEAPAGDWYFAVKHADEGEVQELRATLLLPEIEMTDDGRALLNDFISRHQIDRTGLNRQWDMNARWTLARALAGGLKKKRTRPTTPIYERSLIDARIDGAVAEVRALRKVFGRRVDVDKIAELHGISSETLHGALQGRHGSSQRKAKRRKEAIRAD